MCHERYWRRREEAEESRRIWSEFDRTEPLVDPTPPEEVTGPDPDRDRREEVIAER